MKLKKKEDRIVFWKPLCPDFTQSDKHNHKVVGIWISGVAFLILFILHVPWSIAALLAFVTCVGIAALKEVYDYFVEGHCCEVADFVATIVGGFFGVGWSIIGVYLWCFLVIFFFLLG